MTVGVARHFHVPAVARLNALTPLDDAANRALAMAVGRPRLLRSRSELLVEGREIEATGLLLTGWAAAIRVLEDGRRQVLHLLLPGDLVAWRDHHRPIAASTVVALTDVELCTAPDPALSPALRHAYALARAHERAQLLAQITRLGRMAAQDRIADFALELLERLAPAGLVLNNSFAMPLTQETVADALGLTSVHVNRMVQVLRNDGDMVWSGREIRLLDPERLARRVGRAKVRVSRS